MHWYFFCINISVFSFFVKKGLTISIKSGTLSFGTDLSNYFCAIPGAEEECLLISLFSLDKKWELRYNDRGITRLTVTRSTAGECDVIVADRLGNSIPQNRVAFFIFTQGALP